MNPKLIPVTRHISPDAIRMSQEFGPEYVLCRGNGEIHDNDIHDGKVIAKILSWKNSTSAMRWLERNLRNDPKAFLCFKGKAYSTISDVSKEVPMEQIERIEPREGDLQGATEDQFKNLGIYEANGKKVLKLAFKKLSFLTGKDYPHLCPTCQSVVDQCVEVVRDGEDFNDEEAPLMFAADNNLLCGGRTCKQNEEVPEAQTFCLKASDPETASISENQTILKKGTIPELNNFAKEQGWKFVRDRSLFGGYFVDPKGNGYFFDIL